VKADDKYDTITECSSPYIASGSTLPTKYYYRTNDGCKEIDASWGCKEIVYDDTKKKWECKSCFKNGVLYGYTSTERKCVLCQTSYFVGSGTASKGIAVDGCKDGADNKTKATASAC